MSSDLLQSLGVEAKNAGACTGAWIKTGGGELVSANPTNGEPIASVTQGTSVPAKAMEKNSAVSTIEPSPLDTSGGCHQIRCRMRSKTINSGLNWVYINTKSVNKFNTTKR